MKGYRISRKALEDIDTIWIYTKMNWSVNQANRYYKLIYQEIYYAVEDFESGKDISDIKLGYRQSKVKSHFIIYRKGEDNALKL